MNGQDWTPKKAAFLAAYAKCGNVREACEIAGCSKSAHYEWLQDRAYKKAVREALREAVELMEQEARRRAVEGCKEPVFYKGSRCGSIRRYSDTLLIFLLKAARPKKYRENVKTEHTGTVGIDLKGTEHGVPTREELVARAMKHSGAATPKGKNGTNGHTNGNGKH